MWSFRKKLLGNAQDIYAWYKFDNYWTMITAAFFRDEGVKFWYHPILWSILSIVWRFDRRPLAEPKLTYLQLGTWWQIHLKCSTNNSSNMSANCESWIRATLPKQAVSQIFSYVNPKIMSFMNLYFYDPLKINNKTVPVVSDNTLMLIISGPIDSTKQAQT